MTHPNPNKYIQKKVEDEFVEKGADLEHDRWTRWQKYMFSKGYIQSKQDAGTPELGSFILPKEFVDRWFRKIDTKYPDLSEEEKESDRKETRNYLPLFRQYREQTLQEGIKRGGEIEREKNISKIKKLKMTRQPETAAESACDKCGFANHKGAVCACPFNQGIDVALASLLKQ